MKTHYLLLVYLAIGVCLTEANYRIARSADTSESESEIDSGDNDDAEDDDQHMSPQQLRDEKDAEKEDKSERESGTPKFKNAATNSADVARMAKYRWPNGEIIYRINYKVVSMKSKIVAAMDSLEDALSKNGKKCIKFKAWSSLAQRNYVEVKSERGCWADVGYQNNGKQYLSLGSGCYSEGTMWHEMLHVIGFYHEQSRVDRDKFVNVFDANIRTGMERNFAKIALNQADKLKSKYDIRSIMHYPSEAFSVEKGKKTIVDKLHPTNDKFGQREELTPDDINAVRKLYDCDGYGVSSGGAKVAASSLLKNMYNKFTTKRPTTKRTTTRRPRATTKRVTHTRPTYIRRTRPTYKP